MRDGKKKKERQKERGKKRKAEEETGEQGRILFLAFDRKLRIHKHMQISWTRDLACTDVRISFDKPDVYLRLINA